MRMILGLAALALAGAAPGLAQSQYYPQPRVPQGSYLSQCRDISMNGQFLSASCRGAYGWAQSSINVESCSTDIGVDAEGGLTCIGPGRGQPPSVRGAPDDIAPDYRDYGRGDRRYRDDFRYRGERGYGGAVALFAQRNWRGQALRIDGDEANLAYTGLNDRVRSIQVEPGAAWEVCSDAGFGGRCVTVRRSIADTRSIGLGDSISSIRPLY